MTIGVDHVSRIARLAKLSFSETEKKKLARELGDILNYIEKLNELDTTEVTPLSHPTEVINVMREDQVKPSLPPDEALANAPDRQDHFFKVPKVIK